MKAVHIFVLVVMAAVCVTAQNAPLTFEVASIKPTSSRASAPGDLMLGCHGTDSHSPGMTIPSGRCVARHEPLRLVIALAYDIPPALMYPDETKILSGPDWINSEAYEIEAKAELPSTQAQLKLMLQALLADRFKLKLHRETRPMSVYALVATKNGQKFPPAPNDRDCGDQLRRDHRYELGATSLTGHCHAFVPGSGDVMLMGQSVDMSDLAEMLSIWAGRIVVDKTGIPGLFDIKLPRFVSAQVQTAPVPPAGAGREGIREKIVEAQAVPTVFNVLDQFGLTLESTKAPVEVFVIDGVQKPTEN